MGRIKDYSLLSATLQPSLFEESSCLVDLECRLEQKTLAELASEPQKPRVLVGRLDALSNDVESQTLCQGEDGLYDFTAAVSVEWGYEGAVDLYRVDREPVEGRERRVARTKVVDEYLDSEIVALVQVGRRHLIVLNHHALGYFQLN